jgi:hypothetical protein
MQPLEEIMKQTHTLSAQDRRRLLEYLRSLIVEETPTVSSNKKAPYAQSLALAGTMHSLHTDVSADKYKHLAEAYADRHEDQ